MKLRLHIGGRARGVGLFPHQLRAFASPAASLILFTVACLCRPVHCLAADDARSWKAGAARTAITPEVPMWMSGYAARSRPADGKLHDLWAKALVLEDAGGERLALVTLDLVGIDRGLAQEVAQALHEQHGLNRANVAFAVSHTHSGPVVGLNLAPMYSLDETQRTRIEEYAVGLKEKMIALVGEALENLEPCRVEHGEGYATFAVNRRNNPEREVPRLREAGRLKGPFDHSVPVLTVRGTDDTLRAVVFGYACHATVLDGYQWCGDFPGYAQSALEEAHPEAVAMFWAGCGADQNPVPRRQVELAQQYGRQLAAAVEEVLDAPMRRLDPAVEARFVEIPLPFQRLPGREELVAQAASSDRYEANRARMLLEEVDAGRPLSPTYPYPVQVWRLGDELNWILLGGEVVVDYSLRLKAERANGPTWVAGYANDVMAYIPSRRVLAEGGYEGGGAMVYYGLPSPWAPEVEELIIRAVQAQSSSMDR